MKSLEYIKAVRDERNAALKQVEANPENFDKATIAYAKELAESAEKWYQEALKREQNEKG